MTEDLHALNTLLDELSQKLPHFPDGRIDYSNTDKAPVVIVFVQHDNTPLLLKQVLLQI
jgi:hypothetical protein